MLYAGMRVISKKRLTEFWQEKAAFQDAEGPLRAWHAEAEAAEWTCFSDVKQFHVKASLIANSRVCFNISNNKYRLIAAVDYNHGFVLVKWIGTHNEYNGIDPATVDGR
jgi:mRNA interferase HigB